MCDTKKEIGTSTYEMKVAGLKVLGEATYTSDNFTLAGDIYRAMEKCRVANEPKNNKSPIYWPAGTGSVNIVQMGDEHIRKAIASLASRLGDTYDSFWDDKTKLKWITTFTAELQRREEEAASKRRIASQKVPAYSVDLGKSPIHWTWVN